jgi:Xaa-Pro aminopeptidase
MREGEARVRRQRLVAELRELKLDALIVSAPSNVRYLSGFTGSNAQLILADGVQTLYTDPRYTIQAAGESDCDVKIVVKGSLNAATLQQIKRKKWKHIGIEAARISLSDFNELDDNLPAGSSLKPTSGLIERLRMVKSEAEVDLIRRSVITNSKAFESAIAKFKPKMTESDLAAELEYQMRRQGAEKPSFETIVAAGPRSALPHAQPQKRMAEPNQLLLVDMGALQDGYASDMTRMLHMGAPGAKARKLYKAVYEAQLAAVDAVRENATSADVDRAARRVLKGHGFEKEFVHSTGHGLGLEIHEPPRIGKRDKTQLKAGMVITIEPGAYIEGFGGVRIEDTVLVTKTGCEVLTPTSKELRIV